jgi:hypothetical protein
MKLILNSGWEAEAQRSEELWPRSHSWLVAELGGKGRSLVSTILLAIMDFYRKGFGKLVP